MDQGVTVERRLKLLFGGDSPHRFVAAVDPGHRMTAGQRIEGGAHTVGRVQTQRAVGHRSLLALQIVQGVLHRVMQLPQGQRPTAGAQQHRRRQCGGVDRSRPQDAPGHLDRHLLHGEALGGRVRGDRPVRLTEILAHGNRVRESDINFPVVALTLCLDEVEQPPRSLGDLLSTAGVGRVLGCLVKLVEAD